MNTREYYLLNKNNRPPRGRFGGPILVLVGTLMLFLGLGLLTIGIMFRESELFLIGTELSIGGAAVTAIAWITLVKILFRDDQ